MNRGLIFPYIVYLLCVAVTSFVLSGFCDISFKTWQFWVISACVIVSNIVGQEYEKRR